MTEFLVPQAPAIPAGVAVGTRVVLDDSAVFLDRDFLYGGSPWRLVRLPGGAKAVAESWANGGTVKPGQERFARTLIQQGLLRILSTASLAIDDVDVIIPVRDDVSSLRTLLAQLEGFHVTVVDDASRNDILIEQTSRVFGAHLVKLPTNLGPGGARNAGVRATKRPFVWFLDCDVTLESAKDAFERLSRHFVDPQVSVVAPRIRGRGGSSIRDSFEERFSPLDMGPTSALVAPGGAVSYVPSASLLVRREEFGDGFDERLRVGEDVDFVWRHYDANRLTRYDAQVVVFHQARTTWRTWWHQRVSYGASATQLSQRHGSRLAPLKGDAWTIIAWLSALMGKPAIGIRIVGATRNHLKTYLKGADDANASANELVRRGVLGAAPHMARSLIRTFGPLVALAALHPKLRRRALALYLFGTAWRWKKTPVRLADIPLAIADDTAYAVGVFKGALTERNFAALKPNITKPQMGLRDVIGLRAKNG